MSLSPEALEARRRYQRQKARERYAKDPEAYRKRQDAYWERRAAKEKINNTTSR